MVMTGNHVLTIDWGGVSEQAGVIKDYTVDPFVLEGPRRRVEDTEPVTSQNVIRHGAVFAAVNIIAGAVGQIPFSVRKHGGNREIAERHPLHRVLALQPCAWQTPCVWKEWNIGTALLWGNAVNRIVRNNRGDVVALEPLPPQYTTYDVDEYGTPYYVFQSPLHGVPLFLEMADVVHFRGLTTDGFWGRRLAEVAADDLTLSRAVTSHAAATFINSAVPGGILKHQGKLPPEARQQLRQEWNSSYGGPARSGKTAVLWEGMDFQAIAISNVDAQLLEMLSDDPVRVGRLFQLSPHKLGDYRHSAVRANIEESNREFYAETLSRRVNHMREELQQKCIAQTHRYDVWPDPTELLKGDKRMQVETARTAVEAMLWNKNEARDYLGMSPVEGGEVFENPNTSSNRQAEPSTSDPELPDEDSGMDAILARCRHACSVEASRLASAAKAKRKFLDWVEHFYANAWPSILAEALPGHDTKAAAEAYADGRRKAVLADAGAAKSGAELAERIASRPILPAAWLLASLIVGGAHEDA